MAKKSVEKKVPETESLSELVPVQENPEKAAADAEGKRIKFRVLLRGSYGTYNPGDIATLKAGIADSLIKAGLAEDA